jgi:hypothetical protein
MPYEFIAQWKNKCCLHHSKILVLKKIILVISIVLHVLSAIAQNMTGVVSSDYSGVSRSFINPSSIISSRKYFDLTLTEGVFFFKNNYLFIPGNDYSLGKLSYFDFPTYQGGRNFLDDYTTVDKYANINLRITGPSAMLVIDRHGFVFSNSFRSVTSATNLPFDVAKFMLEGLNYDPQQDIRYTHDKEFTMGSLSWAEAGITYANMIMKYDDMSLSVGISAKRLWAYHGLLVNSSFTDYMTPHSDTLIIYKLNATGGMSLPLDYVSNNYMGINDPIRGKGFAFDAGISFVRTLRVQDSRSYKKMCAYPYEPYQFKIGLSLLDIGQIKFTQNVRNMHFENIDTTWVGVGSLEFTNVEALLNEVSNDLGGSPDALMRDEPLRIALPSAMSFQFDYNFQNNFIVNMILVQDLPMLNNRLPGPSYLSLAPRYSTRDFEIALPLSLYRYVEPRIGLSVRFWYFTAGTEKLGGFFGFSDFDGLDFYFSIQMGLFKGQCKSRFGGIETCPTFN